jgi:tetratricopeptide (TPR) repeat protein
MGGRAWWGVVLSLFVLTACEEPFDAGMQAFEAEKWDLAVERFERVSPFDLRYREAQELIRQGLFSAGEEAFEAGRWRQAISYFRQTTESDENYATARDQIGVSYYQMARDALAAGDAAEALRLSNIVHSTCSQFDSARELAHAAREQMKDSDTVVARN